VYAGTRYPGDPRDHPRYRGPSVAEQTVRHAGRAQFTPASSALRPLPSVE